LTEAGTDRLQVGFPATARVREDSLPAPFRVGALFAAALIALRSRIDRISAAD
jgi:hypothetical protein